ncbi:hypothetical protein K438DRAFT_1557186 [Mycena galopus ATCC 62051]|nr:hypothetical protein K438DRAFT_1557186 [Mycena galopus ATCC 62051]
MPSATACASGPAPVSSSTAHTSAPSVPEPLTPGHAHCILRERCPACFNLEEWGRPLEHEGDVQLRADGCFSQHHLRSAGNGEVSYDPAYFLSKEKVNQAREHIANARKKPTAQFRPAVPQDTIDMCQQSWEPPMTKSRRWVFGISMPAGFLLACCHSQVIFLCDIDTPSEQQHYIVAMLEELNSLLPPQATIMEGYNVGCVTDHSFNLYLILIEGLHPRVSFIISAMHVFGHQSVCQMVYSSCLHRGVSLTDLEGVERFWSRIQMSRFKRFDPINTRDKATRDPRDTALPMLPMIEEVPEDDDI